MKRFVRFSLLLAVMLLISEKQLLAFPDPGLTLAVFQTDQLTVAGDKGKERSFRGRNRDEESGRRGVGARFWGGPYWGYGPRWGHPCKTCRSDCESDEDSRRCKKCRVRCGW